MKRQCRILYHLARADFLERTRRYSFFITILLTAYIGYLYLPLPSAGYLTVSVGGCRGTYNSAYIGAIMSILCSLELSLIGFFLAKGTTDRDAETGVGQIIAASPVSKLDYIFGKTLSNYLFLSAMVGVMVLVSAAMQLVRGEVSEFRLWPLISPFIFITLPTMAIVAAMSVLFESIARLRHTLGNIIYFFLWSQVLAFWGLAITVLLPATRTASFWFKTVTDPFGLTPIISSIVAAAKGQCAASSGISIGYSDIQGLPGVFVWNGMQWTVKLVLSRVFWLGVALGLTALASLTFPRFDTALEKRRLRSRGQSGLEDGDIIPTVHMPRPSTRLTPLSFKESYALGRLGRVLLAELRLMLKGTHWWWHAVAAGLVVTSLVVPIRSAQQYVLPIALILPMPVWSAMGSRETRYRMSEIVFSSAYTVRYQFPAMWLAGLIVAIIMSGGLAIRLIADGQWNSVVALCAGVVFIPSLAVALGVWNRSSRAFEATYSLMWYLGPINGMPLLDYIGATSSHMAKSAPYYYLGISVLLLALAVAGRQRQVYA